MRVPARVAAVLFSTWRPSVSTIGPCCDYHGSKPVLLCDLEIVLLVLMRLRTSEVRELQAIMSPLGTIRGICFTGRA